MKCFCGSKEHMEGWTEDKPYSHLNNITVSTNIRRCNSCGATYYGYNCLSRLHATISEHIANKKEELSKDEVRWLRKHLDLRERDLTVNNLLRLLILNFSIIGKTEGLTKPSRTTHTENMKLKYENKNWRVE